jgi:protein MpaA
MFRTATTTGPRSWTIRSKLLTGIFFLLADHVQTASAQLITPTITVYGHSLQGRPLIADTFGDGSNKTLILASIHGNERNTRPLAEKLIVYLTSHPSAYEGCTVTVVPCVNPDGWAKGTRVNADSVDLNRNFPVGWHADVPGKLKRGTKPLSEPESKALAALIVKLHPQKIASIHNPLHMLDASGRRAIDLAQVLAHYDHYPIPKAGVGYPTPGSLGQFASQYGIATVTLELPRESVDDAWTQNRDALLAAIQANVN